MSKPDGRPRPTGRVDGSILPVGLLAHPFEVAAAALSVVITIGFVVSALTMDNQGASLLQTVLNPPWLWVWGACMAGGGGAILVGIFTDLKARLQFEAAGLSLLITAWTVYVIAVLAEATRNSLIPASLGIAIVLAAAFRIRALFISARVAERTTEIPTSTKE